MIQELLIASLVERHPVAAAQIAASYPVSEVASFLERADEAVAAALVDAMSAWRSSEVVTTLPVDRAVAVLARCELTSLVQVVRHLREGDEDAVALAAVVLERTPEVSARLQFDPGSVGARAHPVGLALPSDAAAGDALEAARNARTPVDTIYVIERPGRLQGEVRVGRALQAAPGDPLSRLLVPVPALRASTPLAAAQRHDGWRRRRELPVVDRDEMLIGLVGLEDLAVGNRGGEAVSNLVGSIADLSWRGLTEALDGVSTAAMGRWL